MTVSASAAPVLWEFQGVTLNDGGSAFGTFQYDADTNTFDQVNVTTTEGTARAGAVYSSMNQFVTYNTAYGFFLTTSYTFVPGSPGMIVGVGGMTNAGGSFFSPWFILSEGAYIESLRGIVVDATYRSAVSGGLVSIDNVPEPSSLWMTACGVAALMIAGIRFRGSPGR